MSFEVHHLDKWLCANQDLAEEYFETEDKVIVFLGGASSSGKSFCSRALTQAFEREGHHCITISLDQYNYGLSYLIPRKVNENYYAGKLTFIEALSSKIKPLLMEIPFEKKYDEESLQILRPEIEPFFVRKEEVDSFLSFLNQEWKNLNFDEPSVYDMALACEDVKKLKANESMEMKVYSKYYSERIPGGKVISGKDYDVILVEGIYALCGECISHLDGYRVIRNFIGSDPKTLFLRRIIRDKSSTSASSVFTIHNYFHFIVPSYIKDIEPTKKNADIIFENDMTFSETRNGKLYLTKQEYHTFNKRFVDSLIMDSDVKSFTYQKDTYFSVKDENPRVTNVLRIRSISTDGGKTYVPSSLVHKGMAKFRTDEKVIRPVNVFLDEKEFPLVWKSEKECIADFLSAGFSVSKVEKKVKIRLVHQENPLCLRKIEGRGCFIEYSNPSVSDDLKHMENQFN